MQASIASFQSTIINYDITQLGAAIMSQISDVGRLHLITAGDLQIFGQNVDQPPTDVRTAVRYGTKFFDALLYFSLENARRPAVQMGPDNLENLSNLIITTKKHLLWMAIFLMLRGSYPSDAGQAVGTNIPAFLRNICGMNISPAELAASLASFELRNLNPNWIRQINWTDFAPEIRQRLGLGLAGYRMLSPFSCYPLRQGVSDEARAAANWVININNQPLDFAILSCTRSPAIVSRYKSWNKSLGNLLLECYTQAQLTEMVQNRIIFAMPVRDPRSDTWRTWANDGNLQLQDPIPL